MKIEVIQLKRGNRSALTTFLRGDNKPKEGEPIFEIDTKKLKIGDGIHNYGDLEYVAGGGIEIEDALDGQILIYNETTDQWEAKALADGQSIEYGENGLRIAGFTGQANQQGASPVVNNGGLNWQQAPSIEIINEKAAEAAQSANTAGSHKTAALAAAADATTAAANAEGFMNQTAEIYSKKFWYGTHAEYVTNVIGQGQLTEGTVYFIYDYDNSLNNH